jgi:hypothetical protein
MLFTYRKPYTSNKVTEIVRKPQKELSLPEEIKQRFLQYNCASYQLLIICLRGKWTNANIAELLEYGFFSTNNKKGISV